VTTDTADPFDEEENAGLWPELYHPEYPFQNCWSALRKQFGWASWETIKGAISALQIGGLLGTSLFLPTFESNKKNFRSSGELIPVPEVLDEVPDGAALELEANRPMIAANKGAGRGATMIFAPTINPATFLHFSWFNESCALRDYSRSPTIMPLEDRSMRTSNVRARITKEIVIRNRRPISDTQYWHETTQNVNHSELSRELGQDQTGSC